MGATKVEPGKSSVAAIILAAGFSSRMKSFKPLLSLGPSSVLETAIRSFQEAGFKDIRVVLGHKAADLLPICAALAVQSILNDDYVDGMFSSVKAGVRSLGPESDGFFLLPVDNPLIQQETLHTLFRVFKLGHKGIVYPMYQGNRGHPPLISCSYINSILNWTGEGGLRALLNQYQADSIEVAMEDKGILLDMDTPEEYQKLLKYYDNLSFNPFLPTEQECYELLKANNTPIKVIRHCEMVARLSVFLGKQLVEAGYSLNPDLLNAAALLHDIARLKSDHALAGARITAAYPEVSRIIAAHMDCLWDTNQPLTEREIVYLADKLVADERIVSLPERFNHVMERHKNEPEVLENIKQRFHIASIISGRVEEIIGQSLETLGRFNLGRDVNG